MRSLGNKLSLVVAAIVLVLQFHSAARAEEPISEFLDGLRDRKLFDVAMEYLDSLNGSPLVSEPMRVLLPYERAKTLIQSATYAGDYDVSEQQLDAAQKLLGKFISDNAQHPLLESANAELGNLMQRRANVKVQRSKKNITEPQRTKLVADARKLYDDAYDVFVKATERLRTKVEADNKRGFIDRQKQPQEFRIREELRKSFLQAQILGAAIREEQAETFPVGSPEYKKSLETAIGHYKEIYTKYRRRMAGLLAQLYLGRTHQKLGQFKDATFYLSELLDQPKNDALRPLKTEALQLAMEIWLHDSEKKYAEAVSRGAAWVDSMRPNERNTSDWIKLRLTLAKAHKLYSEYLREKNPKDVQVRRSLNEARTLATTISKIESPFRREARDLLITLPGGENVAAAEEKDPVDFKQAKKAGSDAVEELKSAQFILDNVPKRIASETDPAMKKQLQMQVAEAQSKIAKGRADAIRYFGMALDFAGPQTPMEEVNLCRYFLAYLNFLQKNYYDAAIIGEFVAVRNSDSASAKPSANIAMACYVQIYIDNKGQDREFESGKIIDICKMIADRWPGQEETVGAVVRLVPFLLNADRVEEAEKYLVQIPVSLPDRANAELRVGQALWRRHRVLKDKIREAQAESAGAATTVVNITDGSPPVSVAEAGKQRDSLKKRAADLLTAGINRVRANPTVDAVLAFSVLYLAQIKIEDGDYNAALDLLDDAKIGILPLVNANHEAVQRKGFAGETYKLALRSYISMLPTSKTPAAIIKKAAAAMEGLKKSVSDDEQGQRRLVGIYFGLARDLEELIKASKSDAEKKVLSEGFEQFVNEVGRGSSEFNVLQWVAETFMGMAKGFDTADKPTAEAVKYYGMAAETFERILAKNKEQPGWIADNARLQVMWRLAVAKRAIGEFKAAMDLYATVLMKRNSMLDVQLDAARTYQLWARSKSPAYYVKAINGGYFDKKRGKNLVWGWDSLARVAFRDPQRRFMDKFWEARLNHFQCHYEYALSRTTKAEKEKHLKIVRGYFSSLLKLTPDLGNWHARFDALYRKVQNGLGDDPVGLPRPAKRASAD